MFVNYGMYNGDLAYSTLFNIQYERFLGYSIIEKVLEFN